MECCYYVVYYLRFEMAEIPDYGVGSDEEDNKGKIGNASGLYPFDYLVDTLVPILVGGMNLC